MGIDPRLEEILKKYHPDPKSAVWNCHGTWVAYHKDIEIIAARAGIVFDMPQIIESDGGKKVASMIVQGRMGEKTEWATGEAASGNNKNSYPWAMAEKRAKDRVVLKLIGLSGFVYSEEEADDFKGKGTTELTKLARELWKDIRDHEDLDGLIALLNSSEALMTQIQRDLPEVWFGNDEDGKSMKEFIDQRKQELTT